VHAWQLLVGIVALASKAQNAMPPDDLLARISVDPKVCGGRPCIRGHRIWVSLVLDLLASGWTTQEVLRQYPGLTEEDVRACVAYAAERAERR